QIEEGKKQTAGIEREIESTQRSMRQIEAQSFMRDADGRLIRLAYPPVYYDLQRDLQKLQSSLSAQQARLVSLNDEFKKIETQLPRPKFTGVQRLIGPEGMPVMVLPQGAAAPATAPGG
ncbi:MAG: hypothetical protein ACREJC_13460, partial [Tepidisphaeraceae bacterium]